MKSAWGVSNTTKHIQETYTKKPKIHRNHNNDIGIQKLQRKRHNTNLPFDFKILNGLNKNTKIVIVQYMKNITDIVLAFKGLEPLTIINDILKKPIRILIVMIMI